MVVWCRHGLVAQALLGASVVVVVVRGLFVCGVAMVPASQVLGHQSFLDVLADLLGAAGRLAVPGWPQRGVGVLGHAVYLIVAVVTVRVVAVVGCWGGMVGGVDGVVSLHLVVVHVGSIGVRLWVCVAGVACDVVGRCGGTGSGLEGVAAGVCLCQVRHAARVGVQVLSVAATGSVPVGVGTGNAVLHAGLAGVGGAVVEDLGAVAASGW